MSDATSDLPVLRVLAYCSLAFYCILAIIFWTAWASRAVEANEPIVFVAVAALVILYFYGMKFAARSPASLIIVFAIAFALVGFISLPFDSTDVFFYIATGWGQAHYHYNPYADSLRDITTATNDPMIQNDWMARNRNPWQDLPLPYGFLFAWVSSVIAWLGHGNLWAALVLFKLLNLAMHAGTALLLWKACRFIPECNPKVVLYLYTWSPLVILQFLTNAHNDIAVGFLIMLAAYLLLKDRLLWILPALAAAGLIKYVAVVLMPFAFMIMLRRRGWKAAIGSLALASVIVILSALPYLRQAAEFKYTLILAQLSESTGSLHAFIVYFYRSVIRIWPALRGSLPIFRAATQFGLWCVLAAFVIRELRVTWSDKSPQALTMIQRWTSILSALIFIGSSQFFAWYIGMLFPIALLTDRKTILADAVVMLSGAHMLSFTLLRRKALGYFFVATLIPIVWAVLIPAKRKVPARLSPAL